ncbi:MAG: GNAT family N-acetyltransferase [Betaproteobacteria bacterium]|nr:GNAT family N-acetyltransferase [Betaproteobacteria bacterium]
MSEISCEEAIALFERMPRHLQLASLHPLYVVADAIRDADLDPVFFAYRADGSVWLHGFHLGKTPSSSLRDAQSAYGYGGPLSSSDDPRFLADAWAAWCLWCRERGVLAEFIRFHPLAANWIFYGGSVVDDRETVVVDLGVGDPLPRYATRARTAVRKALAAGMETVWSARKEEIVAFGALYHVAMHALEADAFYFFCDDYLEALARTGLARLLSCSLAGEQVCAGLFLYGADTVEYHLSATAAAGKKLGATNLLLHMAADAAWREGKRALYLGGGTNRDAGNPLLFFKRGFSKVTAPFRTGRHVHRPEAYAQLRKEWEGVHGVSQERILFYR